jgi:Transcriptional regulatory protein, C terminal
MAVKTGEAELTRARPAARAVNGSVATELLDRLPDGVFRYRTRRGRGFDYVNRTFAVRTGQTVDEYRSNPRLLRSLAHPDDVGVLNDRLERNTSREPFVVRLLVRGRTEWVEIRTTPILDDVGELSAVEAIVRWIPAPEASPGPPARVFGDLRIEFVRSRVLIGDRAVHLTPSELRVLTLLTERPAEVVSREEIVSDLWQSSHVGSAAVAEAHISSLRRKIERDPRHPERIETIRGRGYRFWP